MSKLSMKISSILNFKTAIQLFGFEQFWDRFLRAYLKKARPDLDEVGSNIEFDITNELFHYDNLGELYEIGLEHVNKISKKELGQYYTPHDVAGFMADKLLDLYDNANLGDVCCGTGNLIIEVLKKLPSSVTYKLLAENKIFLFDLDKIAMRIALVKICIAFIPANDKELFRHVVKSVNIVEGNFLDEEICLPKGCFVISNPPYGKLPKGVTVWKDAKTRATNELYALFLEKIALQSSGAVIITPQSFLGSNKYSTLRSVLSRFGGSIWSFDNVPASIFNGRKKGIFNSNTSNSVRAAITVIDKKNTGYRVSPLIRFTANERTILFQNINNLLGNNKYDSQDAWMKIPKSLESLVLNYTAASTTVRDLIVSEALWQDDSLRLFVPSTPRYFISGSSGELQRSSKLILYAKDRYSFDKLYVTINSTFSYLWWRILDGGITLTRDTLYSLPVPNMPQDISGVVSEGIELEKSCRVYKLNAGKNNENIKFPPEYRKKLNRYILKALAEAKLDEALFSIHSNNLKEVINHWT